MGFAIQRRASRRPHVRLPVATISAVLAALLGAFVPAAGVAQYMYLDANGDGIVSQGDVLSPTDTTWVDIWIDTAQNRDGSAVTCAAAAEPVTIFSYEFILRAVGGSVRWGPYRNLQGEMGLHFGEGAVGTDFYSGYGGIEPQPPGLYRLGRLGVVVSSGTPYLECVSSSPANPYWETAFGSNCPGREYNYTLRLGSDWFDWNGIGWGNPSPNPPVFDPIPDIVANVGETTDVTITAVDSDGDPIQFSKVAGPAYMTIETLDPGTGRGTGRVRLTPLLRDPSGSGTVRATDGIWYSEATFGIQVYNANTPPALASVSDMTVSEGSTVTQTVFAYDPDGQDLVFLLPYGPSFATVEPVPAFYGRGLIRVAPLDGDEGVYFPQLSVSDGVEYDQDWFQIMVYVAANRAPALDSIPDLFLAEGADTTMDLSATDPDGDYVGFRKATGPDWISVGTTLPGPGRAAGAMIVVPAYSDSGVHEVWVEVSDRFRAAMQMLHVHVADTFSGETSLLLESEPGDRIGEGRSYSYSEADGPYWMRDPSDGSVRFGFHLPCTLFTYSTPAERASCVSGVIATWTIVMGAAGGQPLAVGEYPNAAVGLMVMPDRPILSVSGVDPYRFNARSCPSGTGRFEILRIERNVLGRLVSFHATFEQLCDGSTAPLRGEIRYHAMTPPLVLVAPTRVRAGVGRLLHVPIGAASENEAAVVLSARELPDGATFTDRGDRTGYLCWTPSPGQQGGYQVRFSALRAGGLRDTASTWIAVTYTNHAPIADANGPYSGGVGSPIAMTSAGSLDPDGDALTYLWNFGDREGSEQSAPEHAYASEGTYTISLTVSDGAFFKTDDTWADVGSLPSYPSSVAGGTGTVRLASARARLCVRVDFERSSAHPDDVLPNGYWMIFEHGGATDSVAAAPSEIEIGDGNGNGLRDATACFDQDDLRRVFCSAEGRGTHEVLLHLYMRSGRLVRSSLPLEVIAPEGRLPVAVAPNPMNPGGTLTFVTSVPGRARIGLYDAAGRRLRTLLDVPALPAGYHDVPLDARAESGEPLASGIYFFRIEAAEGSRTGRVAVVR